MLVAGTQSRYNYLILDRGPNMGPTLGPGQTKVLTVRAKMEMGEIQFLSTEITDMLSWTSVD